MAAIAHPTMGYPPEIPNRNHMQNGFQLGCKRLSQLLGLINLRSAFHVVMRECVSHVCLWWLRGQMQMTSASLLVFKTVITIEV